MERIEKRIVVLYRLRKERINELLKEYHLSYEDYEIVLALHYAEGLSIEDIKKETKIDAVINCAGFGISGAVEFTSTDQAKTQFNVNFFGTVNLTYSHG